MAIQIIHEDAMPLKSQANGRKCAQLIQAARTRYILRLPFEPLKTTLASRQDLLPFSARRAQA